MKAVTIYTDGACSGNPGVGGWCAILSYNGREKILSGSSAETTNNRMELQAAISALQALKEPCEVQLFTDSEYLANAFNKGWIYSWQDKGWGTASKPTPNRDLWEILLKLVGENRVQFIHVRGHQGNINNERCDKIAREEVTHLKQSLKQ